MNQSSVRVLRYLTGNENIEDISVSDLQKLVVENPYFPIARFLLAQKLKQENDAAFLPEVQKTALYFSNPFWLQYQLTDEPSTELLPEKNNFISEKEHTINNKEEFETPNQITESRVIEPSPYKEEKPDQAEEEMAAITREPDTKSAAFLDEVQNKDETFISNDIEQVILEPQTPAGLETAEVLEEMAGATHETDEATAAFLNEAETSAAENIEHSSPEVTPATLAADISKENQESAEPDEHERMFQNIKAMLDATSEEADADTENAVIHIDPYYTIDYFASQGIKLDLDQNPKDELGQHLKKFTQWLKHMKKLGPEDATEVIASTETDADIQKIADSSNTVREVVTEAMASVLEKQGKNNKAIELYNKLSFLNPDKSAYFAAKIKTLKGT